MLSKDKALKYWQNRYKQYGDLTTGHKRHNKEQNAKYYEDKIAFIKPRLPKDMESVYDYGCGNPPRLREMFIDFVGNYDNYTGYDLISGEKPYLNSKETFFTANVLQHNSDDSVLEVLKIASKSKYVILYEATVESYGDRIVQEHCISRYVKDYQEMVNKTCEKLLVNVYSHLIHGQHHSLMIFV